MYGYGQRLSSGGGEVGVPGWQSGPPLQSNPQYQPPVNPYSRFFERWGAGGRQAGPALEQPQQAQPLPMFDIGAGRGGQMPGRSAFQPPMAPTAPANPLPTFDRGLQQRGVGPEGMGMPPRERPPLNPMFPQIAPTGYSAGGQNSVGQMYPAYNPGGNMFGYPGVGQQMQPQIQPAQIQNPGYNPGGNMVDSMGGNQPSSQSMGNRNPMITNR